MQERGQMSDDQIVILCAELLDAHIQRVNTEEPDVEAQRKTE
jgi:hypothetical protein